MSYGQLPQVVQDVIDTATTRTLSAADPTVNDDDTTGVVVGHIWVNTVTETVFVCANNSTGAANWIDFTTATPGGSSWVAGVSSGLQILTSSGVDIATYTLPVGWLANGASLRWESYVLCITNPSGRTLTLSLQLRNGGSTLHTVHLSPALGPGGLSPAVPVHVQGDFTATTLDLAGVAVYFSKGETLFASTMQPTLSYIEAAPPMTGADRLVLVGTADAGADLRVTSFHPKFIVT